jgi:ribosomal subunit interface protein
MQTEPEITFQNLDHSDAIERRVRQSIDRLERFHPRITACRVVVMRESRHHHKGDLYKIRLHLTLPRGEVVIDRAGARTHAHEDVYVAIRDAFNAAARQLEDEARRARGDVKAHEPPAHGRVARLFKDEGFGFIEASDGQEIYFHRNAVAGGGFERLEEGSEVRFVLAEGEGVEGAQASTVHPVGKHHPVG